MDLFVYNKYSPIADKIKDDPPKKMFGCKTQYKRALIQKVSVTSPLSSE